MDCYRVDVVAQRPRYEEPQARAFKCLHVPSEDARRKLTCDDQLSFNIWPHTRVLTRVDRQLVLSAQISGRTVDRHGTLPKDAPEVNGLWFDRQLVTQLYCSKSLRVHRPSGEPVYHATVSLDAVVRLGSSQFTGVKSATRADRAPGVSQLHRSP